MAIVDKVRNFMIECPLLDDKVRLNVDFMSKDPIEYSIDAMPSESIVKKYVGGGTLRQFVFVFASKEFYGADVLTNIANSGFYEDLSRWIEEKSNRKELPNLENDRESVYMEVMDSGYIHNVEDNVARYQLQMRLVYYEN